MTTRAERIEGGLGSYEDAVKAAVALGNDTDTTAWRQSPRAGATGCAGANWSRHCCNDCWNRLMSDAMSTQNDKIEDEEMEHKECEWWWDAAILDPDTLYVTVEVTEDQYTAEAPLWLLCAAGATSAAKER